MRILWTTPAGDAFRRLPQAVRRAVLDRLALVFDFPEMYAVRERQPYAGFRYFVVRNWCVSYVVAEDALVVLAVFPARRGS
ncbi:MAG: type II toxin-antitoxin system RelE/ParE family toxin [Armatimonadota bacterium]